MTPRDHGLRARLWAFPAVVVTAFLVLIAANINGSSIGVLNAVPPVTTETEISRAQDSDLLWGQPRPIRSDEWAVGTPLAVSQSLQDFPSQPWIGLTPTDLGAFSYSTPYWGWPTMSKPHTWGYLLLGAERGLAWSWWFPLALALIAVYALLLVLTRRPGQAAGLAILASFTPYAAWWTSPSPALFVGFGAAAAALGLLGLQSRSLGPRVLLGAASGYFLAALLIVLYPPWSLSVAMVVASLVLGLLVDNRPGWRPLWQVGGGLILVTGVLLAVWYWEVAEELAVISNTVYPGQRVSISGEGTLRELFSAPTNFFSALTDTQPVGSNQSQAASSWVPLPVIAPLGVLFAVFGRAGETAPPAWRVGRWTLISQGAVLVLLLGWSQWPGFPQALGNAVLMSRIPGYRAQMAIGFSLLLLAACMGQMRLTRVSGRLAGGVAAIGVVLSAAVAVWAARSLFGSLSTGWGLATLAGSVLVAATFAAVALDAYWRLLLPVAAVYAIASFAVVNPVYRGLGPLQDDPVVQFAASEAQRSPDSLAITLGGRELPALVRGGGLEVLSGTTAYPNTEFWESVLPQDEYLWNSYRNYTWTYDPAARPIVGTVVAEDAAELRVDLCAPAIRDLGFDIVFSPSKVEAPCLDPGEAVERPNGTTVYAYRLSSGS